MVNLTAVMYERTVTEMKIFQNLYSGSFMSGYEGGGYFHIRLSVCPSVTLWLFLNILKMQ